MVHEQQHSEPPPMTPAAIGRVKIGDDGITSSTTETQEKAPTILVAIVVAVVLLVIMVGALILILQNAFKAI